MLNIGWSATFSYIQAALLVPQIVFLPLGSAFISFNHPWIPMFAATALGAIALLVACLILPEIFPMVAQNDRQHGERQVLLEREDCNNPVKSGLRSRLVEMVKHVTEIYHRASGNLGIPCVLLSLFAFNFGLQADGVMLLLYASKRLHWTLDSVRARTVLSNHQKTNLLGIIVLIPSDPCHLNYSFPIITGAVQDASSQAKAF